jgi:hypothetical protein
MRGGGFDLKDFGELIVSQIEGNGKKARSEIEIIQNENDQK